MAALDLRSLFQKLKEQGFYVERTTQGHWKAVPPDRSKPIVHFSRMDEAHSLRNIISDLKKSGFVWEDAPRSKRLAQLALVPDPPPSEPVSSEAVVSGPPAPPETFPEALRRLRIEAQGTTDTVASLIGVTGQAVSAWELGINTPVKEHYEKLLEIFPELTFAPEPDTRDIPKPSGGVYYAVADEDIIEDPAINPEEPMNTTTPAQPIAQTTDITNKSLIVRFVRLVADVKAAGEAETVELLKQARDAGMSINDVLEMLA